MAQARDRELAEPALHTAARKALVSLREHWRGLYVFVDHPDIPMDSATDIAVHAKGSVGITGNNFQLEWGAVVTPKSITIGTRNHPQYYSGGAIDKDTNGFAPPNCDSPACLWWFSYDSTIPPQPDIDFDFYRSSAQGVVLGAGETVATTCVASPPGSTYYPVTCAQPVTFGNVTTQKGRTIFVEGNAHINSSGGKLLRDGQGPLDDDRRLGQVRGAVVLHAVDRLEHQRLDDREADRGDEVSSRGAQVEALERPPEAAQGAAPVDLRMELRHMRDQPVRVLAAQRRFELLAGEARVVVPVAVGVE